MTDFSHELGELKPEKETPMSEAVKNALQVVAKTRSYVQKGGISINVKTLQEMLEACFVAVAELSDTAQLLGVPIEDVALAEVWLRAWTSVAQNKNDAAYATDWADHCVEAYKARFLSNPNKESPQ